MTHLHPSYEPHRLGKIAKAFLITALERVAAQCGVKPATIQRAISERKRHATPCSW